MYPHAECPADLFGDYCSGDCSTCRYCRKPDNEEESEH